MTHADLYTAYAAYCDLATREVWAGAAFSGHHDPAVWLHIVAIEKFASLHLTRLSGPPIHQKIAEKNLTALLKSLVILNEVKELPIVPSSDVPKNEPFIDTSLRSA